MTPEEEELGDHLAVGIFGAFVIACLIYVSHAIVGP